MYMLYVFVKRLPWYWVVVVDIVDCVEIDDDEDDTFEDTSDVDFCVEDPADVDEGCSEIMNIILFPFNKAVF